MQLLRHNFVELSLFGEIDGDALSPETLESVVSDALVALRSSVGARAFRDMVAAQNFPLQDFVHDAETRSEMLDADNAEGDEGSVILKFNCGLFTRFNLCRSLSEDAGREAYELLIVCCCAPVPASSPQNEGMLPVFKDLVISTTKSAAVDQDAYLRDIVLIVLESVSGSAFNDVSGSVHALHDHASLWQGVRCGEGAHGVGVLRGRAGVACDESGAAADCGVCRAGVGAPQPAPVRSDHGRATWQ